VPVARSLYYEDVSLKPGIRGLIILESMRQLGEGLLGAESAVLVALLGFLRAAKRPTVKLLTQPKRLATTSRDK
jgi:hypothetical protein